MLQKLPKIFLFGSYHGNNFGDLEILNTLLFYIYKDFEISVLTKNPYKLKTKLLPQYFEHNTIRFVKPANVLKTFKNIFTSKYLIIGGGGLFFSYSIWDTLRIAGKSQLLYWVLITITARILGKRVYWFAIGIGPLDKFGSFLTHTGAKFARKIYVRDKNSMSYLETNISKKKLELMSDIVFAAVEPRKVKKNIEKQNINPQSIIMFVFDKINKQELIQVCLHLKKEYRLTLAATNPDQDNKFLKKIAQEISINFIDTTNFNTLQFRNMFNTYDLIISTRMHALLIGLQQGLKGIGITDGIPKIKSLQEQLYSHTMYSSLSKLTDLLMAKSEPSKPDITMYEQAYTSANAAIQDILREIR